MIPLKCGEKYAAPVLKVIDEFMEMPVSGTKGKKDKSVRRYYPSVQYKMGQVPDFFHKFTCEKYRL